MSTSVNSFKAIQDYFNQSLNQMDRNAPQQRAMICDGLRYVIGQTKDLPETMSPTLRGRFQEMRGLVTNPSNEDIQRITGEVSNSDAQNARLAGIFRRTCKECLEAKLQEFQQVSVPSSPPPKWVGDLIYEVNHKLSKLSLEEGKDAVIKSLEALYGRKRALEDDDEIGDLQRGIESIKEMIDDPKMYGVDKNDEGLFHATIKGCINEKIQKLQLLSAQDEKRLIEESSKERVKTQSNQKKMKMDVPKGVDLDDLNTPIPLGHIGPYLMDFMVSNVALLGLLSQHAGLDENTINEVSAFLLSIQDEMGEAIGQRRNTSWSIIIDERRKNQLCEDNGLDPETVSGGIDRIINTATILVNVRDELVGQLIDDYNAQNAHQHYTDFGIESLRVE